MTRLLTPSLTPLRAATATLLLMVTLGASAQTQKAGLWEITTNVQSGGKDMSAAMAAMQKQMDSLPPDQRKMMQDIMAKQGVSIAPGAGGGMSVKVCLTQEMADRNYVAPAQDGCTHTMSPRVGNTIKFAFQCTQPPSAGQGEVVFASPESYRMKMSATSGGNGKDRAMDMQATGRWVGAQCGDIKPISLPAK